MLRRLGWRRAASGPVRAGRQLVIAGRGSSRSLRGRISGNSNAFDLRSVQTPCCDAVAGAARGDVALGSGRVFGGEPIEGLFGPGETGFQEVSNRGSTAASWIRDAGKSMRVHVGVGEGNGRQGRTRAGEEVLTKSARGVGAEQTSPHAVVTRHLGQARLKVGQEGGGFGGSSGRQEATRPRPLTATHGSPPPCK